MESANKGGSRFKNLVVSFFTKNLFLKIISLIFAMLLWGYLLMDQNPVRYKTVNNVDVNIEGEADLIARKLVVLGDKEQILGDAAVRVSTELTKYADLDAEDITATISLKSVTGAGKYALPITAHTSEGTTVSVSPANISVEIDHLVTRRIPVEVSLVGELPAGYWNGTPTLGRSELEIEGAKSEIGDIVKAVCTVDLTSRTESIYQSMDVKLYTEDGTEIVATSLLGQLPTVTVRMEILKAKTVPLNVDKVILGGDALPVNYEVTDVTGSVTTARIVGQESVVDAIDSLDLNQIDISGRTESLYSDTTVVVPEGVRLLDGADVHVYVNIREKLDSVTFEAMPIEVRGLGKHQTCTLDTEAADVLLSGRISLISLLERGDVTLFVDVTDMQAGEYSMHVIVSLPNDEMTTEIEKTLSVSVVKVTIADE